MLTLDAKYTQETLYSIWSAGRFLNDDTFVLSFRIFVWPEGEYAIALNHIRNSVLLHYLRRRYPSILIAVSEFNLSLISEVTPSMTHRYGRIVAARLTLAFCVPSDYILSLDSDTLVVANPFPALHKEILERQDAVLFGVQDMAAVNDVVFRSFLDGLDVSWATYQHAAVLVFRPGAVFNAEIRKVYNTWAHFPRELQFAEQDALALWFNIDLKAMMRPDLNRQWADCNVTNKKNGAQLICHGRMFMSKYWNEIRAEMIEADFPAHKSCLGL
jgi:hypothetical protein